MIHMENFETDQESDDQSKLRLEELEECDSELSKVKLWLLDSAIHQFRRKYFFQKRKFYFPDEVFGQPGMTEPEMVEYMKHRGATTDCIFYAQRKFKEASVKNPSILVDSNVYAETKSDTHTDEHTMASSCSSATYRASYLRKTWKRLKKFFG